MNTSTVAAVTAVVVRDRLSVVVVVVINTLLSVVMGWNHLHTVSTSHYHLWSHQASLIPHP